MKIKIIKKGVKKEDIKMNWCEWHYS